MSRWICVDDICIPSDENDWEELVAFADAIAEQEPIDIVRCGECKYCDKGSDRVTGQTVFICQRKNDENLWEKMRADDFCSYGNCSEKPNNSERGSE